MATALFVVALSMLVQLTNGLGSTDTITWGGDNTRAGYQSNHNMDPAVVGSDEFTQIFKTALPGNYNGAAEQIFSQPLVYTPSNGTTQYVYFATTQNNVYKLDAKTGEILLSRNLAIPFLTADLNGCVDINPLVGVTSTGVIDPDTDTLYLTTKTYANQAGGNTAQGKPNGRYYLHALDVNDLAERDNFPVDLEGIVARNNEARSFNGGIHHQRPGLLHSGQYIYAGFASHCVQYNFTGWLMGFDKTTGAVVERYATEGENVPNTTPGAGIWMSGGGLASDDQGSLFFASGNGYASQLSTIPVEGRNPPTSLEEAAVHMSLNDDGSVTIVDFFMPQEKQALDGADKDLGTSPLEILPSEFACGSISRIGVVTGKSGKTYFLNLDDLGGYRTGADSGDNVIQVYQNENSVYAGAGVYPLEGGYIYINVIQYPTHVFKFSCNNGVPTFTKVADSPENNAYTVGVSHGTVTSLNGQAGTGLLWTTDVQGNNLRIYNAVPENGLLTEIKSFSVPGTTKFSRAVFGDGRIYMGTTLGYVYGFGGPTTAPLNCSSPIDFGSLDIADAAITTTVTCKAVIATTVKNMTINDNDFSIDTTTVFPKTLAAGATFTFSATFSPITVGKLTGSVSITTNNGVTGYASTTSVVLEGTGVSAGALLEISPSDLTFTNVVVGANSTGVQDPVTFSNGGNSTLDITDILFSETGVNGPWSAGTKTSTGYEIGAFSLSAVPATIPGNSGSTIEVSFNPTTGGNYTLYVLVASNGGNQTFEISGNAGPASTCLVEFQTPDGLSWVTYENGMNFTFGNVTENTSRTLKMRVTNNGTSDAVPLSITVSKPPFGVSGIIQANNQVDLGEGTILKAGESATASLYCAVPKEQWNTDTYYGSAQWTMNTNDPNWDKQYIQFSCVAVSEQAPPLQGDGEGTYRYVGCYKENNPGRQLSNQLYSNVNNTISMCIAACAAGSYTYCGTQYNTECWAGNTIPVQSVSENDCNYACGGNNNQICGGNGIGADEGGAFISLFAVKGASTNSTGDGGTTTNPNTGPSGDPVVNPGEYGYNSIGCYNEPATGRALSNQLTTTAQTVEDCLLVAAAKSYKYAGVEYGGECWAGNTLATGASAATLTSCSMTCNGNSSEYCGGPVLLNMYALNGTVVLPSSSSPATTTSTPAATGGTSSGPVVNPGEYGYNSIGCYNEPAAGRALSNQLTTTAQTVEDCLLVAAAKSYKYAGVEYGGECWAGNTLATGASAATLTSCSMTCNGNSSEYCGGPVLLNMYALNGTVVLPSSSSPATTTSTPAATGGTSSGPVVNPGEYGYNSIGCYNEPATGRALSNQLTTTAKTVEDCLLAAAAKSYKYAGVEYGGECWAGNTLATGASAATLTSCSMTCNGNSSEYCGGPVLLNMYALNGTVVLPSSTTASTTTTKSTPVATGGPFTNPGVDGYAFIGCYNEPASGRAFTNQLSTTNKTVAACIKVAAAAGYTYAAVEYGGECWVGQSINTASTKAATSACSMTCNGNTTEYCGGSLLLDVYQLSASTTKVGDTNPVSSSVPTAVLTPSSTSTTTVTAHTTKPTVGNWIYQGCYTEGTSSRALTSLAQTNNEMTYEECASFCSDYAYFGVEYGDQCYCGNFLSTGSTNVSESNCSTYCAGDASKLCGAGNRLNVYRQTGKQTGLPVAQARVGNYAYLGCYSEGTATRALAGLSKTASNMTQELCASYCSTNGNYTMFGVEYSTQCYCGNTLGVGSTAQVGTSCNMQCGGSAFELCGGGNRLNVYTYSQATAVTAAGSVGAATFSYTPPDANLSSGAASASTSSAFSPEYSPSSSSSSSSSLSSSVDSILYSAASSSFATPSASSSMPVMPSSARVNSSPFSASISASAYNLSSSASNTRSSSAPVSSSLSFTAASISSSYPYSSAPSRSSSSVSVSLSYGGTKSSSSSFEPMSTFSSLASASPSSSLSLSSSRPTPVSSSSASNGAHASATVSTSLLTPSSSSSNTISTSSSSAGYSSVIESSSASTHTSSSSSLSSTSSTSSCPPVVAPTAKAQSPCLAPVIDHGNANFTVMDCYQEPSSGHLLSNLVLQNSTMMTVQLCLSKCWDYSFAGLENGDECWCGNLLNVAGNRTGVTAASVVSKSQCSTVCPGNHTEFCGAQDKLLVYNLTRVN